ncbi:prepilin-type N-terminal cleavage/methylation domain-containing protein [candidate division WWE3 bacterium]|uniref:Prepilin-type N-terminal cleavage/methylation domain-containing protein n=1 Tax=candidate division WWE3 bacterium TaxID=2053526 RepID=A0A955LWY6_UNCKA|nr:prepilin-type N-terminal cleavage/methylation domain-containing protein [candidate division WWE3 bacterium]MCA9398043.1 prepilin-type N-terminal cleavage/methylation domain-containing protein [candidate division WWE3 bacterium]
MQKNTFNNSKGLTLIEVVIYIAISALLLVVNLGVLVNILRVRAETVETQDLNFAMNTLSLAVTQDLRWGDTAQLTNGGAELEITKGSDTLHYYRQGNALFKEENGTPYQVSPNNVVVTSLAFEDLSTVDTPPSIRVTIQAYGATTIRQVPATVTTTVSMRNKSVGP